MAEEHLPHKLQMSERKNLTMTGVTEVVSFDEGCVVLQTSLGLLVVQGQQLQLKNLSLEGGQVAVEGSISALSYEEPRQSGWRRLFRCRRKLPLTGWSARRCWGRRWACFTASCVPCGPGIPSLRTGHFFWRQFGHGCITASRCAPGISVQASWWPFSPGDGCGKPPLGGG